VMQPMDKLAKRIGGMKVEVVGTGERRDRLQYYVDQATGFGDALEWLAWAEVEGLRFLWNRADWDKNEEIFIPDFRGCGRMKWKAGGNFYWTGWGDNRVAKLQETYGVNTTDVEDAKPQWYDRKQAVVFRPGAGDN